MTDRYQTTVPEPVRRALGLSKRDAIHYEILADGQVRISKGRLYSDAKAIASFLAFLETDVKSDRNVARADTEVVVRLQQLVAGVDIDLDAPLNSDDD